MLGDRDLLMLDRAIGAESPILLLKPTEMMSELMGRGFATVARFLSFVAGNGDTTLRRSSSPAAPDRPPAPEATASAAIAWTSRRTSRRLNCEGSQD
jgi:hypothetical protein